METLYFIFVISVYLLVTRYTKIPPYAFIIFIVIFSLITYFPGIQQDDTNALYTYFTTGNYSDWQPPIYTIWWHIFHIRSAEFIMNTIVYYSGLIYISYYLSKTNKKWQNDTLILFSFYPLYMTQLVICLKDNPYTGFLTIAICILLQLQNNNNKLKTYILLVFLYVVLFFAVGFKYNGMFAVLPIIVYATYLFILKYYQQYKKYTIYYLSMIFGVILTSSMLYINNLITFEIFKAKHSYSSIIVMYNDMANIECSTGNEIIPDKFFVDPNRRELMCNQFFINFRNYEPLITENWSGMNNPSILRYGQNSANEYQEIKHVWINAISSYPIEYLQYRYQFLENIIFSQWWWTPLNTNVDNGVIRVTLSEIAVTERKNFMFFNGLFLVFGTLIALFIALKYRKNKIPLIIIFSSILQLLSLFLVLGVPAARFFAWNYLAIILTLALSTYEMTSKNQKVIRKQSRNHL